MIFEKPAYALSESELAIAACSFDPQERAAAYGESHARHQARLTLETTATPERDTPFMFWLGSGKP